MPNSHRFQAKLERSNIYIVDPTSPYAHCIVKTQIEESVAMGFTFAKFDFINYAAYEGVRYNMTLAPTGMAAYTYALRMIRDQIAGRMVYPVRCTS